jgi:hypothetical protein
MPLLVDEKEQNEAFRFLKQRDFDKWNANDVQLWLTFVDDGFYANSRKRFQLSGSALARFTKKDLIRRDDTVGDALYYAIQKGMNCLCCHPFFLIIFFFLRRNQW